MSTAATAPTRYLDADGVHSAYRIIGAPSNTTTNSTTPPLLLLNHFRSTIDLWDPLLIDNLTATGRQVITYDYAGHGHSSGSVPLSIKGFATNLISFLHVLLPLLNLTSLDVVGYSIGGYVAQQAVLDSPDLFRKLVLAGTGPSLGPDLDRPVAETQSILFGDVPTAELTNAAFFPALVADQGAAWLNRSFSARAAVAGKDGEPPFVGFLGPPNLYALTQAYLSWDADPVPYSLLQTIQKDVLVMAGSDDLIVPTRNSYTLAHHLSRANLVTVPTSGHGFMFQYAESVAKLIGGFLDGKGLFPVSPFSAGHLP